MLDKNSKHFSEMANKCSTYAQWDKTNKFTTLSNRLKVKIGIQGAYIGWIQNFDQNRGGKASKLKKKNQKYLLSPLWSI